MTDSAKWIWYTDTTEPDDYAEFFDAFAYAGGEAVMEISVDSDYTLWINGEYVASNQYGDFEHYKIYDTLNVTHYLRTGENQIKILVHYCGFSTSRYRPAAAGLLYAISVNGDTVAVSREQVLSRRSSAYRCGLCRMVSSQLGLTFSYDATKEDEGVLTPSHRVKKDCRLFPRPIAKLAVFPRCKRRIIPDVEHPQTHYLIDLGEECVGFPTLALRSTTEQTVTVAWGEHIEDGGVRKIIEDRNFYYEYRTRVGENRFTNYMLRLGCRYLEVFAEEPMELFDCGILPHVWEISEKPCRIDDERDRAIYDICMRTLRCCMLEHYTDTPWREQALYAFDSRNQMLFGYDAFVNGNADYARANLKLIGEDRREDGLLSICYPAGKSLAIPSFSLYYIIAMREYADHTGDLSLATELLGKMRSILEEFLAHANGGLMRRFDREGMWNFYDWAPYLSGSIRRLEEAIPDLILNCLFLLALEAFQSLCARVGSPSSYVGLAERLRALTREEFSTEKGVLTHRKGAEEYTELGNALAVLASVVTGEEAEALCDRIVGGELSASSLSMNIWKYEALLQTNEEKYRDWILGEIRRDYGAMLDAGSTTVWETAKGASDFHGAGSLCHGWSAIPVAIYHRLGIAKPEEDI